MPNFAANTKTKLITAIFTAVFVFIGLGFVQSSKVQAVAKTHEIKFYINPSLVPDLAFAKQVLPKYVDDMNFVLAKNTTRQFAFNPDTDIILTTTSPQCNCAGTLPVSGYEVWADIQPSISGYSYDGFMSFDQSGAAVLAGLKWTQLYDPNQLVAGTEITRDYWTQIDHMLHEFAHVFGAGIGEYYSLAGVSDTTATAPLLNINVNDANDSYWGPRAEFQTDPLLRMDYGLDLVGNPTSRAALLNTVKYSSLTAAIMSGDYRQLAAATPMPDINNIRLRVFDSTTHLPVPDATVKIWQIITGNGTGVLQSVGATDSTGQMIFAWGTPGDPHNNWDSLKLIKVYSGSNSKAQYVSIYDADTSKLVGGSDEFVVDLYLSPAPPPPPPLDTEPPVASFTNPIANATVSGTVMISANASDNVGVKSVEFQLDQASLVVITAAPYQFSWDSTTVATGPHNLVVLARDAVDNFYSTPVSFNVNNVPIDTIVPTVSITAPTNNQIVTKTISVGVSAQDNIGVSKVELYRNSILVGTNTTAPYQFSWNTAANADGTYNLQAFAYDAAGNRGTSSAISVKVDNTAPTINLTQPLNNSSVSNTITIAANATDSTAVTKVEFYRDSNVLIGTDSTSPYSMSFNTATIAVGAHKLFAKAYDSLGNISTSALVNITVLDITAPATAISSPANGSFVTKKATIVIAANASDNVGVTKVEFYVAGTLTCTDTQASYTCSWLVPNIAGKSYALKTKAYDAAGNATTSAVITVTSR